MAERLRHLTDDRIQRLYPSIHCIFFVLGMNESKYSPVEPAPNVRFFAGAGLSLSKKSKLELRAEEAPAPPDIRAKQSVKYHEQKER